MKEKCQQGRLMRQVVPFPGSLSSVIVKSMPKTPVSLRETMERPWSESEERDAFSVASCSLLMPQPLSRTVITVRFPSSAVEMCSCFLMRIPSEKRSTAGQLCLCCVYPIKSRWTPTTSPSSIYTRGTRGVTRQVTS